MEFLREYGMFLAQTATLVVGILVVLGGMAAAARGRGGPRERLEVRCLNHHYRRMGQAIAEATARNRRQRRRLRKDIRRRERHRDSPKGRVFVLEFRGDLRASAVEALREEVSALLAARREGDRALLRLESPGGAVPAYGLAASQLARLREAGVPLTVCIDQVAASGGYMMACVADEIVAAPFAVVGSIGVVAQLPNFHRLLQRHDVDYEMLTAGEFKRTLSLFGENTDAGRAKLQQEIDEVHTLFKDHIRRHRPGLDLDRVATGEYWLGERALELGLVDAVGTSDDRLLALSHEADLLALHYRRPRSLARRLRQAAARLGLAPG